MLNSGSLVPEIKQQKLRDNVKTILAHFCVNMTPLGASNWFYLLFLSNILYCFILSLGFDFDFCFFLPANIGCLINCARQRGQWDFVCRTKQLVLISCLEDSTNEVKLLNLPHIYFKWLKLKIEAEDRIMFFFV